MLAAKNIETTNSNSQMLSRWSKGKFHDFSLLFTLEDVFDGRLGLALEVDHQMENKTFLLVNKTLDAFVANSLCP